MKYWVCPYCHAHLDFGERCSCQDEEKESLENENSQNSDMSAERYAFI